MKHERVHYYGSRTHKGCVVLRTQFGTRQRALNPRNDLQNHSPDGFQWGYMGSGPAQLALALVADALGDDELAQKVYQPFKFSVLAKFDLDEWAIDRGEILAWVNAYAAGIKPLPEITGVIKPWSEDR